MTHDGLRALRPYDGVSGYAHADALLTPRQPERRCWCGAVLEPSQIGSLCELHRLADRIADLGFGLAGNEPRVA